jgi:hypothetical protein
MLVFVFLLLKKSYNEATVVWQFPEYAGYNSSLAKIRDAAEQAALNVLVREISLVGCERGLG